MHVGDAPLDARERAHLVATRHAHQHSQVQCAEILWALGAPGVTQSQLSRWETGATRRIPLAARSAIRRYLAEHGARVVPAHRRTPRMDEIGEDPTAQFAQIVRDLTREPLLGDLQREFVLAVLARLRAGAPLSESDERSIERVARLLNLETFVPRAPGAVVDGTVSGQPA